MFNTQAFLGSLSGLGLRTLFYPSSGNRHGFVCGLNADIFVFSDYRPKSLYARRAFWRRFVLSCAPHTIELIASTPIARVFKIDERKWGLFLFVDNNIAAQMIRKAGLRISSFVGHCDGCTEGGNYECCNRSPFMEKILALMPDDGGGMYIITDHSPYLFKGGSWGKPRLGNFRFVIGDNIYGSHLISDRVPGFPERTCEFIVRRKSQLNEIEETIPRP